jgi:hypothetical protein
MRVTPLVLRACIALRLGLKENLSKRVLRILDLELTRNDKRSVCDFIFVAEKNQNKY